MKPRHSLLVIACLSIGLPFTACSKPPASASGAIETTKKAAEIANQDEAHHACEIATNDEVAKFFDGAKPGKRDDSLLKQGIAMCQWDSPANLLVAQTFKAQGSADDEARSRALGVIDPMKQGAGSHFRYEKLEGVGDGATLIVESGDPANGVFNDVAVIAVRNGDKMAVLFAHSLINGDRDATVKVLKALGRKASGRLVPR